MNICTLAQNLGYLRFDCLFKNTLRNVVLFILLIICLTPTSRTFAQATCQAFDPPDSQFGLALENVLPSSTLSRPVAMVQPPNDSTRWFVVDNDGKVEKFNHGSPFTSAGTLVDLTDRVLRSLDGTIRNALGLLSIAVHPNFNSNGYVYLYYSAQGPSADFPLVARLARYTSTDNGQTLDPNSEQIIFEIPRDTVFHWGGQMWFHPVNGYLYMSIGDGGQSASSQNYDDLNGSFIRIDVDSGSPYSIPPDNPFVNNPNRRGEIYAKGLRNPWQWSFDSLTNRIFLGDVGAANWEEINEIKAGQNYGWPIKEGFACFNATTCNSTGLTDPVVAYPHGVAGFTAVLGGYIYRGSEMPNFYGKYIYGDITGQIWTIDPDDPNPTPDLVLDAGPFYYGFAEDHNRELYLLGDDSIEKLKQTAGSNGGGNQIPSLLSQTGCFDSTDPLVPNSALISYDLNAPLWSDNAEKQRWMRLPNNGKITVTSTHDWTFPIGSVLVKNFKIQNKLIETRLFVRHDNGDWAGYTYEWNNNETDATLLPSEGKSKVVANQTWSYPSRSQCVQCHTPQAGFTLGPETAQLNMDLPTHSLTQSPNQLTELANMNIFANGNFSDPTALPKLAFINDESQTKHWRARSYLYSNCAMCHQPGGPGRGPEDFRYTNTDAQINAINVDPAVDDLGINDGKLIFPGQPNKSIMSLRMHSLDSEVRMPSLGTTIVDEGATDIVDQWITSLASPAPDFSETCGAPQLSTNSPDGVYLWRNCGAPLRWLIRVFAADTTKRFEGKILSDVVMTNITPNSVEASDSLVTSQAGKQISFDFKTNRGNTDGFNFSRSANASTCLSFDFPVHSQIRLGRNATEVDSNTLDLNTLLSCEGGNNNTPTLSIADLSTEEGGSARFTLRLSPAASNTVTVNFQTNNGTATAGADYVARSGKITFRPGETVKTRTVTILQDNLSEGTENLTMSLSNPVNANLGQSTGTATITDDDTVSTTPTLSIADLSTEEGGSARFTLRLSPAASNTVTVNFQTNNGTATAGADYVARSGKITFRPGETVKTRTVTILQDNLSEGTENLTMSLSNPVNANLGQSTGTATITDDDSGGTSSCGEPSIDRAVDQAIFLWQDCTGDGKWHVMATAADTPGPDSIVFGGDISTNQSFSGITPVNLEIYDIFTTSAKTITFGMRVSSPWYDGFEFYVAAGNTCMTLSQPGGQSVFVGSSRSPVTPPFDIKTLGNCIP